MRLPVKALVAFVAVLAGLGAVLDTAAARSPYDGAWTVTLTPTRGECTSSFWFGIRVINGRLYPGGSGEGFRLSGAVSGKGAVRASVTNGSETAHASGRLSRASGRGSWVAPTRRCYGVWTAVRS